MRQQPVARHSMTMFPAGGGDTKTDNLTAKLTIDYILTKKKPPISRRTICPEPSDPIRNPTTTLKSKVRRYSWQSAWPRGGACWRHRPGGNMKSPCPDTLARC